MTFPYNGLKQEKRPI